MPFPLFYRVCFIILDICLPFYGIYAHLFAPTLILGSFTPHYVNPPATETQLLLDAIAGFFASLAFLQIVFLYTRPHDLTICVHWKGAPYWWIFSNWEVSQEL